MSVTSNQLLDKVKADIAEVTVAQVEADLKAGKPVHVVDVRERDEVMDGYIPGADAERAPRAARRWKYPHNEGRWGKDQ